MIEVEDQEAFGITKYDGDAPAHKAFNREEYAATIKGLKKEELFAALTDEAHIRYNVQCELADERWAFRKLKDELNAVRKDVQRWKSVADHLRHAVQVLMAW